MPADGTAVTPKTPKVYDERKGISFKDGHLTDSESEETSDQSKCPNAHPEGGLSRAGTLISQAGTTLQRAGTNLQLQRANTLPTNNSELRHAATMPMMFDVLADRPWWWGLWKTQQLVGFLLGISLMIVFVAARPMKEYPKSNEMLGVTSLVACFWVFEVIPVYMTALFPLVLMPLLKVTSSEIVAQAYWSWISLLVVGTYLVDIALEEVHLPRRIALKLLLSVGTLHPAALLACFMVISWILAMFCNSIAIVLMITPFAISVMNASEEHVRDMAAKEVMETGESGDDAAQQNGIKRAAEVQSFADALLLGIAFGASIGGIATITGAIGNYFLAAQGFAATAVSWSHWFLFALPISVASLLLAYLCLAARYVRRIDYAGLTKDILEEEYQFLKDEVGEFSRDELLVGLLQVLQFVLFLIRPSTLSPILTTQYGENLLNDATLACAPALLLFLIPSSVRPGQALLTWPAVHRKFDFGLLLLIGGSLAISQGFTESGLNVAMGDVVAKAIPRVHPFVLNLLIMTSIALSTQIFSSIGTAATLLPVLSSAALNAVVNPLSLDLPATVATSLAFVLPTATPTNVIVLAKSQELARPLRFRDFFSNGIPLTIAAIIVGSILCYVMGDVVFDSQAPFPDWACEATGASCLWVEVPGLVQGRYVQSQACIVNVGSADGNTCLLWNKTVLNTTSFVPNF